MRTPAPDHDARNNSKRNSWRTRKHQTQAEPRLTTTGQHLPFFVVFSVSCEPQSASVDPPVEPLLLQSLLPHTLYYPLLSSLSLSFSHQLLFRGYSLLFIPRILVLLSLFIVTPRLRVLSVVLSSSSPLTIISLPPKRPDFRSTPYEQLSFNLVLETASTLRKRNQFMSLPIAALVDC